MSSKFFQKKKEEKDIKGNFVSVIVSHEISLCFLMRYTTIIIHNKVLNIQNIN